MTFLNRANEILEIINIEIDISWNSTSVNVSTQTSINNIEISFNTNFNAISEKATTAVVSSEFDSHIEPTFTITQSSETESSIEI